MPIPLSTDKERIERSMRVGKMRKAASLRPVPSLSESPEGESMPRIVMPPPPVVEMAADSLEDEPEPVEGESDVDDGDEDVVANPGVARVAIPQSTAFVRLNRPEDEI